MEESTFGINDMALTLEARADHFMIKQEILEGPRFAFKIKSSGSFDWS